MKLIAVKLIARAKSQRAGASAGSVSSGGTYTTTTQVADKALSADEAKHADRADIADKALAADRAGYADRAAFADKAYDIDPDGEAAKRFLSRVSDDTALGLITFTKGAAATGVTLTEAAGLHSPQYTGREFTDTGFKVWQAAAGQTYAVIDELTVRRAMRVFELIINKVRATGGTLIVTPANGRVKTAGLDTARGQWRLTLEDTCPFVAGDLIRCSAWRHAANGAGQGTQLTAYWAEVADADSEGVWIAASEFGGQSEPAAGDEVVLLGNTRDPRRQGAVSITATEGGAPRIDILDGIKGKTLAGCAYTRLGALDGTSDAPYFKDGEIHGYGLWSANAYLRGDFILRTGESVSTRFEITDGRIDSAIEGLRQDLAGLGSFLSNATFGQGLYKWDTANRDLPFLLGGRFIWTGTSYLAEKSDAVKVEQDGGRTVAHLRNADLTQRNDNLQSRPTFAPDADGTRHAIPVYLTFHYRCAEAGTLTVTFDGVDQTGFAAFTPLHVTERIEATAGEGYRQFTCSGLWNGTGDFRLRFTGDIRLHMLLLTADRVEGLAERYQTLFQQTDRLIRIAAAVYDHDAQALQETGLLIKPEGAGLYAQDAEGHLATIGTAIETEDNNGTKRSVVKLTGDDIRLEGNVTANGGFSIDKEGNVTARNATFSGFIRKEKAVINSKTAARYLALADQSGRYYSLNVWLLSGWVEFQTRIGDVYPDKGKDAKWELYFPESEPSDATFDSALSYVGATIIVANRIPQSDGGSILAARLQLNNVYIPAPPSAKGDTDTPIVRPDPVSIELAQGKTITLECVWADRIHNTGRVVWVARSYHYAADASFKQTLTFPPDYDPFGSKTAIPDPSQP